MNSHSGGRKIIIPMMIIVALVALVYFVVSLLHDSMGEVPSQSTVGTIVEKTYKPASTYNRRARGAGGKTGFNLDEIPIAEAYHLSIAIAEWEEPVGYSANIVDAKQYELGQQVIVTYVKKQRFFFSKPRIVVLDIEPASTSNADDAPADPADSPSAAESADTM